MENYAKVILYAYPLLQTVGEDYEEHIRNKAVLSYDSPLSAEKLTEYLAREILAKENLEWLKSRVEGIINRLSEEEKTLVAIRFFGQTKRLRKFLKSGEGAKWSERQYFRKQQRLADKVGAMMQFAGITERVYKEHFASLDIFEKIDRFVSEGRDRKIAADERRWLND